MSRSVRVVVGLIVVGVVGVALVSLFQARSAGARSVSKLQRWCDDGLSTSCFELAVAYRQGEGVARDDTRAYSLLERACGLGSSDACVDQGLLLIDGRGVARDDTRAAGLFRSACDVGNARACGGLAYLHQHGQGVARDVALAITLFQRACDWGKTSDCTRLGWLLSSASDPEHVDEKRALRLFEHACESGELLACRRVAQAHECGRGTPENLPLALEQFLVACRAGDAASCERMARHHAGPAGLERFPGSEEPSFQGVRLQAAIEATRIGRREHAERLLQRVEGVDPTRGAEVAFIRACLAADAGDLAGAESRLSGLPEEPAVRVLRGLLARRREGSTQWVGPFVSAWVAEGRPDLRGSRFLPAARVLESDEGSCSSPRSWPPAESAAGFLREFGEAVQRPAKLPPSDALLERALVHVEEAHDEVRIVALTVLTHPSLTPAQRERAHPVAARHLELLARAHPQNLFYRLWAVLGPTQEGPPLSDALLTELEALSSLPWAPPRRELHRAFQDAYAEVGESAEAASNPTVWAVLAPPLMTATETWETQAQQWDAEKRRRLGRQLMSLGERVAEQGWLVHTFQGSNLQRKGAALTGRPEDEAARAAMLERGKRFYQGPNDPRLRLMGSWPLPGLTQEWIEQIYTGDEMAFFEGLAGLGAY